MANAVIQRMTRINSPLPKLEASNGLRFSGATSIRPLAAATLNHRRFPVAGKDHKSIHFFAHRPADFKRHDVAARRGDHRIHRPFAAIRYRQTDIVRIGKEGRNPALIA